METTTLSFANFHNHGELFANLFRARRESFIVRNKWDLPEAMGMEYDQYDTPASRWIAVHEYGQVFAGIRLTPTTMRNGIYSYMIRDAQRGLLHSLPEDLLGFEAPVSEQVWESSRVFVSESTPHLKRARVHAQLFQGMTQAARELGATQVLCLIPAVWPRWTKRLGMDASGAGPVMHLDGVDNQCVSINLVSKLH